MIFGTDFEYTFRADPAKAWGWIRSGAGVRLIEGLDLQLVAMAGVVAAAEELAHSQAEEGRRQGGFVMTREPAGKEAGKGVAALAVREDGLHQVDKGEERARAQESLGQRPGAMDAPYPEGLIQGMPGPSDAHGRKVVQTSRAAIRMPVASTKRFTHASPRRTCK